jgi:tRNA pseudouridine38-40 synthase
MNRIALGIEYDGSRFRGWQRQAEVYSVQEALENALSQIADHPVYVVAAGRTDAGVHATAQVVHFDSQVLREDRAWVYGSNAVLPPEIRVLWCRTVPDSFDARRSAILRRYRYLLYNHPIRPSLLKGQVGWYYRKLNREAMEEASQYWLGEHDFSSFRAAGCQAKTAKRCSE